MNIIHSTIIQIPTANISRLGFDLQHTLNKALLKGTSMTIVILDILKVDLTK